MVHLWIALAGVAVFVGASFLPWIAVSFAGSEPGYYSFWQVVSFVVRDVKHWDFEAAMNVTLWLLPICVTAIIVFDLIGILRRQINKALTTWMFILSLVCLVPLVWSLFFFKSYLKALGDGGTIEVILSAPHIGYFLTFLAVLTMLVGSAIGLFRKNRAAALPKP